MDRCHQQRQDIVKSKPIDRKLLQKLPELHKPRDFVRASKSNQEDFYGENEVSDGKPESILSNEEKNRIAAKILRAEMLGNMTLVNELKVQLLGRSNNDNRTVNDERADPEKPSSSVLLTKTDLRSGLVYPVRNKHSHNGTTDDKSRRKKKREDTDSKDFSLRDLLEMEKFTSAEDQLAMFGASSSKIIASEKIDDSWTIDDALEEKMTKGKKSFHSSDFNRTIKDYKRQEHTLENCVYCVESKKLERHLIVTLGLKTYLSVPANQPIVDNQCCIIPMWHLSSCVQMDEDIYDEMKIWRKGIVAMFKEQDMDVIFIETAKNVNHQPHTIIDCYPVSAFAGDTAPMYFKKALLECEEEWAQNKKIVDLSKKEIRKSIPCGFSYFAVDFDLQGGYGHVIENESKFPRSFGQEIVCGMLGLDENLWRRPVKQTLEEQLKRTEQLKSLWKPFDWTERVKERLKNE